MTEPITLSFTVEQDIPAGSTLVLTVMPPEVIEPPPVEQEGSWQTIYEQELTTDNAGWEGYTLRQGIDPAGYAATAPATGTQLRVTLADAAAGASWSSSHIGHGNGCEFDGDPVPLWFDDTLESAPVEYAWSKNRGLVFSCFFDGPSDVRSLVPAHNYHGGWAEGDVTLGGGDLNIAARIYFVSKIEVFSTDPPGEAIEEPPPVEEVRPPAEALSGPERPISVAEVTMADRDEVCLEVRDDPITHGQIISNDGVSLALTVPGAFPIVGVSKSPVDGSVRIVCSGGPFGAWYFNTASGLSGMLGIAGVQGLDISGSWDTRVIDANTADLMATHYVDGWVSGTGKVWDFANWTTHKGKRGWLAGAHQDYFRPCDLESTCFLNRSAARWPDNWEVTGRTVTAVYIKSKNYDHGYVDSRTMGKYGESASLKHFIHLKLDGPIEQGVPYLVANDEAGILAEFTFDDRTTRAQAIHVTGVGHRPDDASKLGYVSMWRPGAPDEGAVDYGHLKEFEIIDSNGVTVGGPYPITLRIAADEAEERLGVGVDNILGGYPDADNMIAYNSTDPEKIFDLAAVSVGNPAEFQTDSDHGFEVGTKLRLIDMGGDGRGPSGLTHMTVKVATVPSPNTFTAAQYTGSAWTGEVSTVGMPPYADWLACGRTGKVARLNQSNRAGTNVYALDYSKFVPTKPGTYRLRIAGLGVSDPVFIAPRAWGDVARAMAMGEYHHRWGISLDGRFGVTRPANYVDGVTKAGNQGKIYQSVVPYPFGWGAPLYGIWPPLNDAACARPEAFLPDGKGGWHQSGYGHGGGSWADAGDWCTRVEQVCGAAYCFGELSLLFPQRAAATGFNIPKASEMFPDVSEYADTDDMPEMVHQAIFGLEGYRRMQHGPDSFLPEGSVPGGLMMDTSTGTTSTPSHLTPSVNYANAPDQMSNFAYAFAAAKIAQLCYAYDHNAAGDMWQLSAVKAWDWAEKLYASPEERDAYYGSVLGIPELAAQQQFVSGTPWTSAPAARGIPSVDPQAIPRSVPKPGAWSTNTYLDNCEALNRAAEAMRTNAGASLFRLTGGDDYRAAAEQGLGYTNGNPNGIWFDPFAGITLAAWEYAETPGVNEQARSVIRNQFTSCHTRIEAGVEHYSGPIKAPCRTMMIADGGLWNMGSQGIDVSIVHWALICNHLVSGDPRALAILQDGMSFIYGANPLSMSFVAQVGHRWPGTIFHADSLYAGRECDAGIGCYGFHFLGQWAFAFGTWKCSANAGCIESPDPRYTVDHIFEREIDPGRYATPIFEAIWESHYQLNLMERSIQQDVFPLQNIAFYLDAWDER